MEAGRSSLKCDLSFYNETLPNSAGFDKKMKVRYIGLKSSILDLYVKRNRFPFC